MHGLAGDVHATLSENGYKLCKWFNLTLILFDLDRQLVELRVNFERLTFTLMAERARLLLRPIYALQPVMQPVVHN
jgi:hypothetical protein